MDRVVARLAEGAFGHTIGRHIGAGKALGGDVGAGRADESCIEVFGGRAGVALLVVEPVLGGGEVAALLAAIVVEVLAGAGADEAEAAGTGEAVVAGGGGAQKDESGNGKEPEC